MDSTNRDRPVEDRSSRDHARPERSGLRGLVIVNLALLAGIAAVTLSPAADAQARLRGNYVVAAGDVPGTDAGVIYIVDTTTQELVALGWDPNQKAISGIGYRNLQIDAATALRAGAGR